MMDYLVIGFDMVDSKHDHTTLEIAVYFSGFFLVVLFSFYLLYKFVNDKLYADVDNIKDFKFWYEVFLFIGGGFFIGAGWPA